MFWVNAEVISLNRFALYFVLKDGAHLLDDAHLYTVFFRTEHPFDVSS